MHSTWKYILPLILAFTQLEHTSSNEFDPRNVTILHEVENDPLELNTHEVLPSKPIKKKPYAILDKPSDYVKIPAVKGFNAHAVAFDFNLGDLEDVHETILPDVDLSSEERHLLRNTNDEDLTYSDDPLITPSTVSKFVTPATSLPVITTTTTEEPPTTSLTLQTSSPATAPMTTSTTELPSIRPASVAPVSPLLSASVTPVSPLLTASVTPVSPLLTASVAPVSPHIFKILSKNKSKVKGGHEFLQKDEQQKSFRSHSNSISQFFGDVENNTTADALQSSVNVFQLLVNLYDHFYWQPSEIRSKVSPACGVEILSYLSALNSNYAWAQKAYDSSGHYRGQLFFGSNKWLGQRQFCLEVNRNAQQDERKHFEFEYYVATVRIAAWVPANLTVEIQLGECLPKSCTVRDVESILHLDPHAQMVVAALAAHNDSRINITSVRTVPGPYCVWKDVKFILFIVFSVALVCVVLVATWYESELNRRERLNRTSDDAKVDPRVGMNPDLNGKAFEAYQMTQIGPATDNNNVDIEAELRTNGKQAPRAEAPGTGVGATKPPCSDFNANHVELSCGIRKTELGIHQEILLCFALQKNAATILSVEQKAKNQTSCVHGLRVFSVLWTIMVHTYLQMFTIGENRFLRVITERMFFYQFVGNATFSVDTFFFISGFLVTLLFLRQDNEHKKAKAAESGFVERSLRESFLIVIYRYIRLTPAYMFVILFNELSLRYTYNRSVFQPTVAIQTCSDYWWRNVLYINNFFPLNQICMIWSWYMANDMQFYVMATLLLIFSKRYFKTTILILAAFLLSSWAISGVVSINYNYTHKVANPFESFNFLYDKPWQRVGTYIVGMIAGYIVFVNKTPPKISSRLNLLLWTASLGLLFVIICGVWSGQLDVITTAFYVSIGHTAFGVGLVWIVLSCCWGLANPVNKVLSYPGLLPLSRLTYCTYLVHPVIMLLTSFQMEGTVHLNNLLVWIIFLGNAVLSFVVAFFISVLFEAPVVRLLKLIFKK